MTAIGFSRAEWATIQRALAGKRPTLIDEEWMRSDIIAAITDKLTTITTTSEEDTTMIEAMNDFADRIVNTGSEVGF
tara:strand:- start:62 stop:292 length:231 start_codon:yes stop_codon:yes gene_type:complete